MCAMYIDMWLWVSTAIMNIARLQYFPSSKHQLLDYFQLIVRGGDECRARITGQNTRYRYVVWVNQVISFILWFGVYRVILHDITVTLAAILFTLALF